MKKLQPLSLPDQSALMALFHRAPQQAGRKYGLFEVFPISAADLSPSQRGCFIQLKPGCSLSIPPSEKHTLLVPLSPDGVTVSAAEGKQALPCGGSLDLSLTDLPTVTAPTSSPALVLLVEDASPAMATQPSPTERN